MPLRMSLHDIWTCKEQIHRKKENRAQEEEEMETTQSVYNIPERQGQVVLFGCFQTL